MIRKWIARAALLYLLIILFFGWGVASVRYDLFPWPVMSNVVTEIENFVKGDPFDETDLVDRFMATALDDPVQYRDDTAIDFDNGKPLKGVYPGAKGKMSPLFFSTLNQGYYLVYGIFNIEDKGASPYAVLIDHMGNVRRVLNTPLITPHRALRRIFLSSEGDIVSTNSTALRSYTWKGKQKWTISPRGFHHEISEFNDKYFVWKHDKVFAVNKNDGSSKKIIEIEDLVLNNPDTPVFRSLLHGFRYKNIREKKKYLVPLDMDKKKNNTKKNNIWRIFHPNAVVPNNGITSEYPVGTLLLSFRNIDTVMIVDPKTAKILWEDEFNRQHSPQWHANGISVYNNRSHFNYSKVEFVNFNKKRTTLIDGKKINFYRYATGNHEVLKDGSIILTSNQGEFLHLDSEGKIISRFVNKHNNSRFSLRNVFFIEQSTYEKFENGHSAN